MNEYLNLQPSNLNDDLVELRLLRGDEFEDLYNVASDPLIWEMHPDPDRYKRENFQAFFGSAVSSGSAFLIYEKQSGALMGTTRYYDYKKEESSVAIGYTFLGRKYWGGAFNSAVKKLLLDHAFRSVETVFFHVGANNLRSQKAVLKLGAVKVREFIFDERPSKPLYCEFAISRNSWLQRSVKRDNVERIKLY